MREDTVEEMARRNILIIQHRPVGLLLPFKGRQMGPNLNIFMSFLAFKGLLGPERNRVTKMNGCPARFQDWAAHSVKMVEF